MIAAHLRTREKSREQRGRDNERARGEEREREEEMCDDAEKNASDTHENKNDYVPRHGRALRVTHTHVRNVSDGGGATWERRVG